MNLSQIPPPIAKSTPASSRKRVKVKKTPITIQTKVKDQELGHDKVSLSSNYPKSLKNLQTEGLKSKKLKVLSCNTRSITNKFKSTLNLLHQQDIDIAVFSELNTKRLRKFPGYTPFIKYSKLRFDGVCILF